MKKVILYILGFVILCFVVPFLGATSFHSQEVATKLEKQEEEKKAEIAESTYDYQKYQTVKLLHSKTGEIQELPLDEYLYGVVSAEMPADFELEALKAQAVVARTYTIYKITTNNKKHGEAAICDSASCCQAWITKEDRLARWEEDLRESNWNKIRDAVNSTQGKIIIYEGKPINAFFHSNSGGTTELPVNVWGGSGYPYLQAVQTAGEDSYSQYASEVTLSKEELEEKIKEKHNDFVMDWNAEDAITILEYTDGERVKTVKIGNLELSGVEVRTLLGLRSANFEVVKEENKVTLRVKGYGHGVGMSQTGADSMAKQGSNYEEIIHHFYTGVIIQDM